MAQVIKKATRESFGMALCELAKTNKDIIVFDADLAAATKTGIFKKEFPERFFDCGIAEGNMVGVAAGMAAAGKIPVAASFAMFATGRAFEQIRNSVAYPHLNVKIAGSHAGISTGEDGATHQCLEDIGIMRTIPGMVILNPADHYEMMAATKAAMSTTVLFISVSADLLLTVLMIPIPINLSSARVLLSMRATMWLLLQQDLL